LLNPILENAPLLVSSKDLDGNVLSVNSRFNVLKGPSRNEYIGKNIFELFPRKIADELWANDVRAQVARHPIQAEESVHHKDGSLHTYQTTKFRLEDDNGRLTGTCAVSIDVTALKRSEQEAQHDYLTGLNNQRYLENNIMREIARRVCVCIARSRQF